MKRIAFLFFLLLSAATAPLGAQDAGAQDTGVREPRLPLLSVIVSQNDCVAINVNTITSIAMHNYRLNGDNLISQVTIDTMGNNTIRFYYVHPAREISPVNDPRDAISKVRQQVTRESSAQRDDADVPAVKFPEGTYAHSIEFQIGKPEELKKFYKTALSVWEKRPPLHVKFKFNNTKESTP